MAIRTSSLSSVTACKGVEAKSSFQQMVNGHMFPDASNLKDKFTEAVLSQNDDVTARYKDHGCAQAIARSDRFARFTMLVIATNTLWIGIEMELNLESNLLEADWYFQVGEWFFIAFFLFEWFIRFFAFRLKRDCLRDMSFCFDSMLVALMCAELCLFPILSVQDGDPNASKLSLLRLMRLLRLTRVVRFMRAVPELVSLMKSLRLAAWPVMWTMVLLFLFLYIFAVAIRSQFQASITKSGYLTARLNRLPKIMYTLLIQGTLMEKIQKLANSMLKHSPLMTFVFMTFVLLTSLTLLNLLVGVLVDVMNSVAVAEKEKASVAKVKAKVMDVLEELDKDGSGTISKAEFNELMGNKNAVQALNELGVDVVNLLSLSDHIFQPDAMRSSMTPQQIKVPRKSKKTQSIRSQLEYSARNTYDEEREDDNKEEEGEEEEDEDEEEDEQEDEYAMNFRDFLNNVMRLRSTNPPSVVDIVDLRKLFHSTQHELERHLESVERGNVMLAQQLQEQVYDHPFMQLIRQHPRMQQAFGADYSISTSYSGRSPGSKHDGQTLDTVSTDTESNYRSGSPPSKKSATAFVKFVDKDSAAGVRGAPSVGVYPKCDSGCFVEAAPEPCNFFHDVGPDESSKKQFRAETTNFGAAFSQISPPDLSSIKAAMVVPKNATRAREKSVDLSPDLGIELPGISSGEVQQCVAKLRSELAFSLVEVIPETPSDLSSCIADLLPEVGSGTLEAQSPATPVVSRATCEQAVRKPTTEEPVLLTIPPNMEGSNVPTFFQPCRCVETLCADTIEDDVVDMQAIQPIRAVRAAEAPKVCEDSDPQ